MDGFDYATAANGQFSSGMNGTPGGGGEGPNSVATGEGDMVSIGPEGGGGEEDSGTANPQRNDGT